MEYSTVEVRCFHLLSGRVVLLTVSFSICHKRTAQGKECESRKRSTVLAFVYHLQFVKYLLLVRLSVFDYFSLKWIMK
jgi:hypothetical protein